MEIGSQRHLFDIPKDQAFFNCAFESPQLNESRSRLLEAVWDKSHPWKRVPANYFDTAEQVRALASKAFGSVPEAYSIIAAASYGMSTAARAIEPELNSSDVILLIAEQFPSNVLPWQRTADETGCSIITAPVPSDGDWTRSVLESMDASVKVVAVPNCHWTNGAYVDLKQISQACKKVGAYLVIDATQSWGAMPLSIEEIDPDFLIASGYKWLLSPYGFGLMYVAKRWWNARPLEESWLARKNSEDFSGLIHYSDEYMEGARRFDVGQKCAANILPGVIAALEQISAWTVDGIADALQMVNDRIASKMLELGFGLPNAAQRCPHMFGATLPEGFSKNLIIELKKQNIYISQRGNAMRFSPHLHVTEHDLDRLFDALEKLMKD